MSGTGGAASSHFASSTFMSGTRGAASSYFDLTRHVEPDDTIAPTLIRWLSGDVETIHQARTVGDLRVRIADLRKCFAPSFIVLNDTLDEEVRDNSMALPLSVPPAGSVTEDEGGYAAPREIVVIYKPIAYQLRDWREAVVMHAKARDVRGIFRAIVTLENSANKSLNSMAGANTGNATGGAIADDAQTPDDVYGSDVYGVIDIYQVFATAAAEFYEWCIAQVTADRNNLRANRDGPAFVCAAERDKALAKDELMRNMLSDLGILIYRAKYFPRPILSCAARQEQFAFVEQLLLAKAAVTQVDELNTALHHFAEHGDDEMVKVLIGAKCDVTNLDSLGDTPLHKAALGGHLAIVNLAGVDQTNVLWWTPLHQASRHGHVDIVSALLDAKADANRGDGLTRTALHWSAREGLVDVIAVLLAAAADVNAVDDNAQTPLQKAEKHGHAVACALLRAHGGDICTTPPATIAVDDGMTDARDKAGAQKEFGEVRILRNEAHPSFGRKRDGKKRKHKKRNAPLREEDDGYRDVGAALEQRDNEDWRRGVVYMGGENKGRKHGRLRVADNDYSRNDRTWTTKGQNRLRQYGYDKGQNFATGYKGHNIVGYGDKGQNSAHHHCGNNAWQNVAANYQGSNPVAHYGNKGPNAAALYKGRGAATQYGGKGFGGAVQHRELSVAAQDGGDELNFVAQNTGQNVTALYGGGGLNFPVQNAGQSVAARYGGTYEGQNMTAQYRNNEGQNAAPQYKGQSATARYRNNEGQNVAVQYGNSVPNVGAQFGDQGQNAATQYKGQSPAA
eukprot:GEMP01012392.1.p1 GENE.GEMP01012392.1~~GEMP01012392.1.p1  ORF type:complete len:815 (+),score=232.20 GEMP01012392.1:74-2446(+)